MQAGVDPLGIYIPPFAYAEMQILEQAVNAVKSLDDKKLADYMHATKFSTIVGDIKFGDRGEWAEPRVLLVQYRGIDGNDVEQFKQPGKQVIVDPADIQVRRSGDAVRTDQDANARRARPATRMIFSLDLFCNAIVSGILLGGFYCAVAVGITIAFGMLDIVNIAHPAFIMAGGFIAYFFNTNFGVDPVLACAIAAVPAYFVGRLLYRFYYHAFEKRGEESLQGLAFFFGLLFIIEVGLILTFGVDYRFVEAAYIGPTISIGFISIPWRLLVPLIVGLAVDRWHHRVPVADLYRQGHSRRVAGSAGAAAGRRQSGQGQGDRVRTVDRDGDPVRARC